MYGLERYFYKQLHVKCIKAIKQEGNLYGKHFPGLTSYACMKLFCITLVNVIAACNKRQSFAMYTSLQLA